MMSPAARSGGNQYPYLRNQNVYWDRLELNDVATMRFSDREKRKFRLLPGDLLACEGRFVGRCAIWRGEIDEVYYQKALHRLRSKNDEVVTTDFMLLYMLLRFGFDAGFVRQFNRESTIPHLPLEVLVKMPVPLPSASEQEQIVEAFDTLRQRERAERESVAKLRELKSGLMEDLLTGQVRVTDVETDATAPT